MALPATLDPPETLSGPPVPRLLLTAGRLPAYAMRGYGQGLLRPEVDFPMARLGFRYGPVLVAHDVRAAYAETRPGEDVVAREGQLLQTLATRRSGGARRSGRAFWASVLSRRG